MGKVKYQVFIDSDGNKVYRDGKGIYLKLANRPKERAKRIARIDEENDRLIVKRFYSHGHFYNEINGFGFNPFLINEYDQSELLLQTDIGDNFLVPIGFMREPNREYRYYKREGYELQLFIPLILFEPYRIHIV